MRRFKALVEMTSVYELTVETDQVEDEYDPNLFDMVLEAFNDGKGQLTGMTGPEVADIEEETS